MSPSEHAVPSSPLAVWRGRGGEGRGGEGEGEMEWMLAMKECVGVHVG